MFDKHVWTIDMIANFTTGMVHIRTCVIRAGKMTVPKVHEQMFDVKYDILHIQTKNGGIMD